MFSSSSCLPITSQESSSRLSRGQLPCMVSFYCPCISPSLSLPVHRFRVSSLSSFLSKLASQESLLFLKVFSLVALLSLCGASDAPSPTSSLECLETDEARRDQRSVLWKEAEVRSRHGERRTRWQRTNVTNFQRIDVAGSNAIASDQREGWDHTDRWRKDTRLRVLRRSYLHALSAHASRLSFLCIDRCLQWYNRTVLVWLLARRSSFSQVVVRYRLASSSPDWLFPLGLSTNRYLLLQFQLRCVYLVRLYACQCMYVWTYVRVYTCVRMRAISRYPHRSSSTYLYAGSRSLHAPWSVRCRCVKERALVPRASISEQEKRWAVGRCVSFLLPHQQLLLEAAESCLAKDSLAAPLDYEEGGGAFYGPKLDISIPDAQGRFWQTGTIQV